MKKQIWKVGELVREGYSRKKILQIANSRLNAPAAAQGKLLPPGSGTPPGSDTGQIAANRQRNITAQKRSKARKTFPPGSGTTARQRRKEK